jgi:hypothetical protein
MDRISQQREIVKLILSEYHRLNLNAVESTIDSFLVFDETREHYLLLLMGWRRDERVKTVMIHIRLQDAKIWVEEDWTEAGIATDLLREGIEREEIVLGFHQPELRRYTEFAVV